MTPHSSDISVEPEEIKQGGVAMFAVSDGLHEDFQQVLSAGTDLEASVDTGQFKGVAEVAQALQHWDAEVVPKLRERVEEIGEFLAVYSVQHVELDEVTSEMFTQYADPEVFPVDPASRTSPERVAE